MQACRSLVNPRIPMFLLDAPFILSNGRVSAKWYLLRNTSKLSTFTSTGSLHVTALARLTALARFIALARLTALARFIKLARLMLCVELHLQAPHRGVAVEHSHTHTHGHLKGQKMSCSLNLLLESFDENTRMDG